MINGFNNLNELLDNQADENSKIALTVVGATLELESEIQTLTHNRKTLELREQIMINKRRNQLTKELNTALADVTLGSENPEEYVRRIVTARESLSRCDEAEETSKLLIKTINKQIKELKKLLAFFKGTQTEEAE